MSLLYASTVCRGRAALCGQVADEGIQVRVVTHASPIGEREKMKQVEVKTKAKVEVETELSRFSSQPS
jgi:hypothetical protein